jgi:hypothetical protein
MPFYFFACLLFLGKSVEREREKERKREWWRRKREKRKEEREKNKRSTRREHSPYKLKKLQFPPPCCALLSLRSSFQKQREAPRLF